MKMKKYAYLFWIFLLPGCSSPFQSEYDRVHKTETILEYELVDAVGKQEKRLTQKQVNKYNCQGKLLEERSYAGPDLAFAGGLVRSYGPDGKQTNQTLLDPRGEALTEEVFTHRGNTARVTEPGAAGGSKNKRLHTYDAKGNLVLAIFYYEDGRVMTTDTMKYDNRGNVLQSSGTLDGTPKPTHYCQYDARGNVVEQRSVDAAGNNTYQESFSYESFDAKGNWTLRKSVAGARRLLAERVTEYP
jgi:hypothetical protein